MTRETKISLLVGLAVIVVIGIVVSDHLTVTSRPAIPNLVDTQAAEDQIPAPMPRSLVASQSPASEGTFSSQPQTEHVDAAPPPMPVPVARVERETTDTTAESRRALDLLSGSASPAPQYQRPATNNADTIRQVTPETLVIGTPRGTVKRYHTVKEDESLAKIAGQYYGDQNKWTVIRDANPGKLLGDSGVRVGVRLVIPDIEGSSPAPAAPRTVETLVPVRSTPATPSRDNTITVQPGDTLGHLAQRHLGSAKLQDALFQANRDRLSSPDQIYVGMKLKLPPGSAPAPGSTIGNTPGNTSAVTTSHRRHEVKANETLYGIAQRTLGDGERWREIYQLNQDQLASPRDLKVGQRLRLP